MSSPLTPETRVYDIRDAHGRFRFTVNSTEDHAAALRSAIASSRRGRTQQAVGDGTVIVEVTLIPKRVSAHAPGITVEVVWEGKTLGRLPAETARSFRQLSRLSSSGFEAKTVAEISVDKPAAYNPVRLSLPDAEYFLPLNEPPLQPWALIPQGHRLQVSKESEYLDVLKTYVPPTGVGLFLVTLHPVEMGVRATWRGVEVRLDGHKVGELSKTTSEKLLPIIEHFEVLELTTAARARLKGSTLAVELTLDVAVATEITDADLDPVVSPLPRLVAFQANASHYPLPGPPRATTVTQRSKPSAINEPAWMVKLRDKTEALQRRAEHKAAERAELKAQKIPPSPTEQVRRPKPVQFIVSCVAILLGLMLLLGAMATDGARGIIGTILFGLICIAPATWWFYCQRRDHVQLKAWEEAHRNHRYLSELLADSDPSVVKGMGAAPAFEKKPRYWKFIIPALIVALLFTGAILPQENPSDDPVPMGSHTAV